MDSSTVFQCAIDQMDADDMLDTAHAVLSEMLEASPNPAPPPSFPNPDFGCDVHSQPMNEMSGGYEGYITLETVSLSVEQQLTTVPMLSVDQRVGNNYYIDDEMEGDVYSQGQYLPCEWTDYDATASAFSVPPDPDLQSVTLPEVLEQKLLLLLEQTPAGTLNGEVVYDVPEVPCFTTQGTPLLH